MAQITQKNKVFKTTFFSVAKLNAHNYSFLIKHSKQ